MQRDEWQEQSPGDNDCCLLHPLSMSWLCTITLVLNIFLSMPTVVFWFYRFLVSDKHIHKTHKHTHRHCHTQATLFMSLKIIHTYFHRNKEPNRDGLLLSLFSDHIKIFRKSVIKIKIRRTATDQPFMSFEC